MNKVLMDRVKSLSKNVDDIQTHIDNEIWLKKRNRFSDKFFKDLDELVREFSGCYSGVQAEIDNKGE